MTIKSNKKRGRPRQNPIEMQKEGQLPEGQPPTIEGQPILDANLKIVPVIEPQPVDEPKEEQKDEKEENWVGKHSMSGVAPEGFGV